MGRRKVELPVEVGELRGRIEGWRRNRAGGGRMPEEPWGEALGWARIYGACAISRAMGIEYAGLRTRLGMGKHIHQRGAEAGGGGFVELGNLWAGSGLSTVEVMGYSCHRAEDRGALGAAQGGAGAAADAAQTGSKKKVIMAVARKLSALVHKLLGNRATYAEPEPRIQSDEAKKKAARKHMRELAKRGFQVDIRPV